MKTVTLTNEELDALDFCLFTLRTLCIYEDKLEEMEVGVQALTEFAAEKAAALHQTVRQQMSK